MPYRAFLVSAFLLLPALLQPVFARPVPLPPAIPWAGCDIAEVGAWPLLGARLECARIPVPVDHLNPAAGTIDLGLIRVRASHEVERRGAIFFNFGGPGGNPRELLPGMASLWASTDIDDELIASRKRIYDHFDLVGVIPRGLRGGWTFECVPPLPPPYQFIPSSTDEANLRLVETEATQVAQTCQANPFYKYVNSEQNVRDIDYVRRAMGEEKLNFFGISYGSWIGAWYAAIFPEHVGRMVFDSSMDVTGSFDRAIDQTLHAENEALERRVLRPVAARPVIYGMGNDIEALRQRIRTMHASTRRNLAPLISTPASFVAAMRLDSWLRSDTTASRDILAAKVAVTRFSSDTAAHAAIRNAANALLPELFRQTDPPSYDLGPDGDSVHVATLCNDDTWPTSFEHWRDLARDNALRYPTANGEATYMRLVCSKWGERTLRRPSIERLADAPAFLIVQAEYDHATPLAGAERMRAMFDNAYLVIARNMEDHGIYGQSRTPCVERSVAAFLLNGTLPEDRTTSCVSEYLPGEATPSPDALHSHHEFWRRLTLW